MPKRQPTYAVTIRCNEGCEWSWTSPGWVKGEGITLDDHFALQAVRVQEELDKHFRDRHPGRNADEATIALPRQVVEALRRRGRRG